MSNGVGVVAALSGSVPRIAGPRPSKRDPEGSRGPSRSADSPESGRRPVRTQDAGGSSRTRAEIPGGSAPRPSRAGSIAGSARLDPASGARPASPGDFVRRIAEAFRSAPIRNGSCVRISLSPAHLGDLWIELSVVGSRLRGKVRAGTAAARDLILAHLDDLRRNLEDRGIRISRFEVDIEDSLQEEGLSTTEVRPRSHRRQVLDLRA
jgi:flagellar hook-length control protein FliK